MEQKIIKLFLRLAVSIGFLSAVADRFGLWSTEVSVWGNWENFIAYTKLLNPFIPKILISPIGMISTLAEIIFAICLIVGYKTEFFAKLSGYLLLLFALAMMYSIGIKGVFDYSVLSASATAFALSIMKEKYFELDILLKKSN